MTCRPASYSQNNNQNYFVNEGKTSSRVLQAPGGKSSINLGWDNHNDKGKEWFDYFHLHFMFTKVPRLRLAYPQSMCKFKIEKEARKTTTNNSFASGKTMNSGNVLTERPSLRVSNPPGGRSSICLG